MSPPSRVDIPRNETLQKGDHHQHRRRFIGPLPKSSVSDEIVQQCKKTRGRGNNQARGSNNHDDEEDGLKDAIYNLAADFMRRRGDAEDWDPDERRHIRDEVYKRWKESEWGRAFMRSRTARTDKQWIGTSFDVGVFLGFNILEQASTNLPQEEFSTPGASTSRPITPPPAETFASAPSHQCPSRHQTQDTASHTVHGGSLLPSTSHEDDASQTADSSTALIRPTSCKASQAAPTTQALENIPDMVPDSDPCRTGPNDIASKNKGKTVHYDPVVTDDHPAPPAEVLTRTREAAEHTSAGAAQWSEDVEHVPWGDVVMRDRAYIKFSYSETESLPSDFDEWQNRTTGNLHNEDWAEYIVVWRKNRLELYMGHHMPGKDWVLGHMKLVFVIPLGQSTTKLSLYSFVDLTFCIVCPPAPLRHRSKRRWLNRRHKGLNIFVFKIRSRTRAIDWVWKLWRHLGGELPTSLDIRSPLLDTRVRIDMPRFEGIELTAAYRIFENKNVLRLCRESLSKTGNEHELLRHKLATGAELALAWRSETNLDWVSQLDDVQGNPRKWAILCGLALNQHGKGAHLEVRLKEHFPTRLHLKDGTVLDEPPAVEGYLERIRPNSQLKQSVYLTIHNNYIFAVPIAHAHHSRPPGFLPPGTDADSLRESEVQRGAQQILHATGMTDLRNIIAVRRAFQLVPRHEQHPPPVDRQDSEDDSFWEAVERTESDDEDVGGDVGLSIAQDKGSLHMRRSFELLLTTGNVVRFEAFSCQVALEWIVRLRPLISYWRRRHQADAQTEMQLAYISTGRARITPLRHVVDDHDSPPEPLPDPQASLPELSSFFNWCALEGCRSIVRSGKLFARKGLWGQYKHVQVVLIAGNLVQFRITGRKSLHHHRHTGINLQDAYLVSGYLAAQYLPEGQYDPDAPHLARRYQDGLETDDGPEDTLFMMWYRTQVDPSSNMSKVVAGDTPRLEVKRQLSFFKTRSKLERDAWVWAINMEIEKAVRSTKDREERIREAGNIVKT